MADLFHFWSEDLTVSPSGDLAVVQVLNPQNPSTLFGNDEGTQRIYRRLMTASIIPPLLSGEFIFAPDYGGGIPQKIGGPLSVPALSALVNRQMNLEAAVAKIPAPVIHVQAPLGLSTALVDIKYTNATTGTPVSLAFDPSQNSGNG